MDLIINDGLRDYNLNGRVTVRFNPTDTAFAQRLYSVFATLDEKQGEYRRRAEDAKGSVQIFEIARSMDAEMRQMIDGVFDAPVCEPLFGAMNVFAFADGLPVWANLLLAVVDQIDESSAAEEELMKPRLEQYTAKYRSRRK